MGSTHANAEPRSGTNREFIVGLGRAFAGALIFSLPLLMTMEMWALGFYVHPLRLALLLVLLIPLLIGLSYLGGLRRNAHIIDDVADALLAIAVAFCAALFVLWIFGLIGPGMSKREIVGKLALQIVPGSIGAMLAQNQLGGNAEWDKREARQSYAGEIFVMMVGALFLILNVAPTEEMAVIAFKMTVFKDVGLAVLSIALMHVVVYVVEFHGTEQRHPAESFFSVFARFTVVGYAAVFLVSFYILWTFGRLEGLSLEQVLSICVVLSFPGAIGAARAADSVMARKPKRSAKVQRGRLPGSGLSRLSAER